MSYESLNEHQKKVITVQTPALVLAGAGTGKTKTLSERIKKEYNEGNSLNNQLILTFTKKAAAEIIERVRDYIGEPEMEVKWAGTFHSVFYKILREYGMDSTLLLPEEDQKRFKDSLLQEVKDLKIHHKILEKEKVVLTKRDEKKISMALFGHPILDLYNKLNSQINFGITDIEEMKSKMKTSIESNSIIPNFDLSSENEEVLLKGIDRYIELKKVQNVISFNDIMAMTYNLLTTNEKAKKEIQNMFNIIYVDEAQDTNKIQFMILEEVSNGFKNVIMIGDIHQSIYGFLNARIENIQEFIDKANPIILNLIENYRSNHGIVKLSNQIKKQFKKRFDYVEDAVSALPIQEGPIKPQLAKIDDNAEFVVRNIIANIKNGVKLEDMAVIVRTNTEPRKVEKYLSELNIPFNKLSGKSFFETREIILLSSIAKFWINRSSEQAFQRVSIEYPGVGDITADAIEGMKERIKNGDKKEFTSDMVLDSREFKGTRLRALKEMLKKYESFTPGALDTFDFEDKNEVNYDIETFKNLLEDLNVFEELTKNAQTDNQIEGILANIETFLEDMDLILDGERNMIEQRFDELILMGDEAKSKSDNQEGVIITTAHTAKGLEWPYVYILDIKKGNYSHSFQDGGELLDEQIRLLYVALTRPMKELVLSMNKHNMPKKGEKKRELKMDPIIVKCMKYINPFDFSKIKGISLDTYEFNIEEYKKLHNIVDDIEKNTIIEEIHNKENTLNLNYSYFIVTDKSEKYISKEEYFSLLNDIDMLDEEEVIQSIIDIYKIDVKDGYSIVTEVEIRLPDGGVISGDLDEIFGNTFKIITPSEEATLILSGLQDNSIDINNIEASLFSINNKPDKIDSSDFYDESGEEDFFDVN